MLSKHVAFLFQNPFSSVETQRNTHKTKNEQSTSEKIFENKKIEKKNVTFKSKAKTKQIIRIHLTEVLHLHVIETKKRPFDVPSSNESKEKKEK